MKDGKRIKIAIIVLSVLLAISLLILGGLILRKHLFEEKDAQTTAPSNIITEEKQPDLSQTDNESPDDGAAVGEQEPDTNVADDGMSASSSAAVRAGESAAEAVVSLHARKVEDNIAFQTENMFPGDSETKYFCVQVAHKDNVTLCFRANIRPGYEKLAQVMRCRIALPDKSTVLYDGLMRDMPQALEQAIKTSVSTNSEARYEITAYLETSVGSEYMNESMIVDYCWWVEERANLEPPRTGDSSNIYLWMGMALGSLLVLLVLLLKKGGRRG